MISEVQTHRNLLAAPQAAHQRVEIYSGVARLARTVWASEVRPSGSRPRTAVMICHPTANFMGHYALSGLAARGVAGVGLTTRYVGNDTSLILENCLLDMGSMVAHLRSVGYEHVVVVGNSGGASIVPYYQAQAQSPSVTHPPGGGPDLTAAGLVPADAIAMLNAHPSRARLSSEWLDPAITDEHQPFERNAALDMYDPDNGPPYSSEFVSAYRAAQLERNRRITRWAEAQLAALTSSGHRPEGLDDLTFVVQGTMADLRFLDGSIDPSDRVLGTTPWGTPAVGDYLPAGIGRCATLRSWINQWSIDRTLGDSLRWLPEVEVPVGIISPTADPLVMPHMGQQMYEAAARAPRTLYEAKGANHYFEGQPEILDGALDWLVGWIESSLGPAH
ncbi:MAG: alpha/beta hydrolase [Acidobacteriota bacterium]|nr:alpha/beta hydrolase [Acidobacteriota bacterium]